jgi:outer membrane protein
MKKLLVGLSLLATQIVASETIYLKDLVRLTLQNSPDINVSLNSYEISQKEIDVAGSFYLPRIDVSASVGSNGASGKNNSISGAKSLSNAGVSASQLIYDFGKTTGNIGVTEFDSNASFSQYQQLISNKIRDVKVAYYSVLQQSALINVHKKNVELNKQQLIRSERYFNAGIKTKIDVSDGKVSLLKSQLDVQNSIYDARLAKVELQTIVGVLEDKDLSGLYVEELDNIYELSRHLEPLTESILESETFAYSNRHDVLSQKMGIKSKEESIKSASAGYYPEFKMNANYNHQNNDLQAFLPENQWQATFDVKWNFYEGSATSSKVEQSQIALLQSTSLLRSTLLDVKQEIDLAYINVQKSKDALVLNESISMVSKEKFIQSQQRYENGLSDYIELQEARQSYITSLTNTVISYYDYYIALAELERSKGN